MQGANDVGSQPLGPEYRLGGRYLGPGLESRNIDEKLFESYSQELPRFEMVGIGRNL